MQYSPASQYVRRPRLPVQSADALSSNTIMQFYLPGAAHAAQGDASVAAGLLANVAGARLADE